MGCGASSKKQNSNVKKDVEAIQAKPTETNNPAASFPLDSNKLNVLVLHGTTMDGKEMQGMYRWKECGIETFCEDIANFYYPTGPCIVAKNHPMFKSTPDRTSRGDAARHWWTMTNKWDFSPAKFKDARKTIVKFLNEEVKQPIDVIVGYSQGAAATTQVLNDLRKGDIKSGYLDNVRGAIFQGCPKHPMPLPEVGASVASLHCNGKTDPLTSAQGAKEHAAAFKDNIFFEFEGGHEVRKVQQEPVRTFLLKVKCAKDNES